MDDADEQFAQQQQQIEHLKRMVRDKDHEIKSSNTELEQRLKMKEKELQDAAMKLSQIKLQKKAKNIASKQQSKSKDENTNEGSSPQTPSDQSSRGKMMLLKKKLDENRLKFEKREKEINESQRGIEQTVNSLKIQLQERDAVIEELKNPSKSSNLDENGDKDISTDELYAQIVYKDNKILDLNNIVLEMERKIIDVQETVKEKDELIQARNKAIQLITEDLSRKGKTVVDDLDMTREQMREMQNNFVSKETEWKSERNQLVNALERLENKSKSDDDRIAELVKSAEVLEANRFKLVTVNAELQERCVHAQENVQKQISLSEVKMAELKELANEKEKEIEELKSSMDSWKKDYEKEVLKLKGENRTLSKSFESKTNDLNEIYENQVLALKEKLLETEKSFEILERDSADLGEQVSSGRKEMDAQNEVIQSLRKNLENQENSKKKLSVKLNDQIKVLQSAFDAIKLEKGALESKISEKEKEHELEVSQIKSEFNDRILEDQRTAADANAKLEDEVTKLKLQLEDQVINNEKDLKELEEKYQEQISELEEQVDNYKKVKDEYNEALKEKNDELKGLEVQIKDFKARLGNETEKAGVIADLQNEIQGQGNELDKLKGELRDKCDEIEVCRSTMDASRLQMKAVVCEKEELNSFLLEKGSECDNLKTLIDQLERGKQDVEDQNMVLKDQAESIQSQVDQLTKKLAESDVEIQGKNAECQNFFDKLSDFEAQVRSKNEENEALRNEVRELKQDLDTIAVKMNQANSELELRSRSMDEIGAALKCSENEVNGLRLMLEEKEARFVKFTEKMASDDEMKNKMADLMTQLSDVEQELVKQKAVTATLETRLNESASENLNLHAEIDLKLEEITHLKDTLTSKDNASDKAVNQLVVNLCPEAGPEELNEIRQVEMFAKYGMLESMIKRKQSEVEENFSRHKNDLEEANKSLSQDIQSKDESLNEIGVELEKKNEIIESMKLEVNGLRTQIADNDEILRNQHGEEQTIISSLQTELLESQKTIKVLSSNLDEQSHQINQFQSASENLETEVMKKVEVITVLNDQIESLTTKEAELVATHQELKKEYEVLKLQSNEESLLCDKLKEELRSNMDQADDISALYDRSCEELNEMRQRVETSELRVTDLEKSNSELTEALRRSEEEMKTVVEEKGLLEFNRQKMQMQIERLQFYEEEYKKVAEQLNDSDEKQALANQNAMLSQQLQQMEAAAIQQAESFASQSQSLTANIGDLELKLKDADHALSEEKQALANQIATFSQQLQQAEQAAIQQDESSASHIQSLTSKISDLEGQFKDANNKLGDERQTLVSENTILNEQLQRMEEAAFQQAESSTSQIQPLTAKVADLELKLKDADHEAESFASHIQSLTAQISDLESQLSDAVSESQRLLQIKNEIEQQKSVFEEAQKAAEKSFFESQQQLAHCQQRITELETAAGDGVNRQIHTLRTDLESCETSLERTRKELNDERGLNREIFNEREELREMVCTERECSDDLRQSLQVAQSELQKQQTESKKMNSELRQQLDEAILQLKQVEDDRDKKPQKRANEPTEGWDCEIVEPEFTRQVEQELGQGAANAMSEGSTIVLQDLQIKHDNLTQEHQKLKSKTDKMFVKLKLFKDKSDKLQVVKDALEKEQSELHQKLQASDEEKGQLLNQIEEVNKGKSLMSGSLEKQATKMQEMAIEKNELLKQLNDLQSKNKTLMSKLEEEQTTLANHSAANEEMRSRLQQLQLENGEMKPMCERLRSELNDVYARYHQKNDEMQKMALLLEGEKNSALEAKEKIYEGMAKISSFEEQQIRLSSEMQSLQLDNDRLRGDSEEKDAEIEQLKQVKMKHDLLKQEMERCNSLIRELQAQRDDANDRLANFEAKWMDDEGHMGIEMEQLKIEISQLRDENRQLQRNNAELDSRIQALLQRQQKISDELDGPAKPESTEHDILNEDKEEIRQKNLEFDNKLIKFEKDQQDLLSRRHELEVWFAEASKHFDESKATQEKLAQQVTVLGEKSSSFESQNAKLREELHGLRHRCEELKQRNPPKESSELIDLTVERLRAELQRAMESLHHKDRICEEMKDSIAQLQEEKYEYMSRSRSRSSLEEDVHSLASSPGSTIINVDDSSSDNLLTPRSSPRQSMSFFDDGQYDDLRNQLMHSEKDKVNLQAENTALNDALSMEQRRRHDTEMELKSIKQVMNLDLTSPSKSDYHLDLRDDFRDEAPLLYPETDHYLTRTFKSHSYKLRRWFRGRQLYTHRTLKTKSWFQISYYVYIFALHVLVLSCIL